MWRQVLLIAAVLLHSYLTSSILMPNKRSSSGLALYASQTTPPTLPNPPTPPTPPLAKTPIPTQSVRASDTSATPGSLANNAADASKKRVMDTVERVKVGGLGALLESSKKTKGSDKFITRVDLPVEEKRTSLGPLEVYEGVKESVYLTIDAIQATGTAIKAVGGGVVFVAQTIADLPSTIERTSASTAKTIDAVIEDIEEKKAIAGEVGRQVVRVVTLEDAKERIAATQNSIKETKAKLNRAAETVSDVALKISGKKPLFAPPPPKPQSNTVKALSAVASVTVSAAKGVIGGAQWLLKKRDTVAGQQTPTKSTPNKEVKGKEMGKEASDSGFGSFSSSVNALPPRESVAVSGSSSSSSPSPSPSSSSPPPSSSDSDSSAESSSSGSTDKTKLDVM